LAPASSFDAIAFLAAQLDDCETHWSLGAFGALAEFSRYAGEPVELSQDERSVSVVTPRGGIRVEPPAGLRFAASESATRDSWNHRVALCLSEAACAMNRRTVLTELGPDVRALRAQDRDAVLFDLGLGLMQADACIRVADADVTARLRACAGRSVFDTGNPGMAAILAANPHRVFVSKAGRIEVFQPIPPPDGKSPDGPHTHVLPKLLAHKRTHAATEPVPDGLVPCAHFYPAHPAKGASFDTRRHDSFQTILRRFGDPGALALKDQVAAAIAEDRDPSAVSVPRGRFARANVRVTVRQWRALHAPCPGLARWIAAHDQAHDDDAEFDTEIMHG
jgi:hypothetical protein